MEEIENLPDEILLYNVLPRLNMDNLTNLCKTNTRINNICQDEMLWKLKTINDFPLYFNKKGNLTWRKLYLKLNRGIPVYVNGDVVNFRKISLGDDFINKQTDFKGIELFLGDDNLKPIMVIIYMGSQSAPQIAQSPHNLTNSHLTTITKIINITQDNFNYNNPAEIMNAVFSLKSQYPIYGKINNNNLYIIHSGRGGLCQDYDVDQLLRYLQISGIDIQELDINNINLCQLLLERLEDLHHIMIHR